MHDSDTPVTTQEARFSQHYLNCRVCSEVMKTVNIGDNQSPEQENAVRRKAFCRIGRRLYDRTSSKPSGVRVVDSMYPGQQEVK